MRLVNTAMPTGKGATALHSNEVGDVPVQVAVTSDGREVALTEMHDGGVAGVCLTARADMACHRCGQLGHLGVDCDALGPDGLPIPGPTPAGIAARGQGARRGRMPPHIARRARQGDAWRRVTTPTVHMVTIGYRSNCTAETHPTESAMCTDVRILHAVILRHPAPALTTHCRNHTVSPRIAPHARQPPCPVQHAGMHVRCTRPLTQPRCSSHSPSTSKQPPHDHSHPRAALSTHCRTHTVSPRIAPHARQPPCAACWHARAMHATADTATMQQPLTIHIEAAPA